MKGTYMTNASSHESSSENSNGPMDKILQNEINSFFKYTHELQ
jgi:hypothetical protein